MNHSRNMKFGVLADSFLLKKWQLIAIQQLQNQGNSFELLILKNQISEKKQADKTYQHNLKRNFFYRIFQKLFFKVPLLTNIETQIDFQDISKMYIDPIEESAFACHFKKEDIDFVRSKNLDFILRFGFNIIHGDILKAANYGIWSFHHDDEEVIRGGPPGFWEIYENHDVNGIVLQQLTDELDKGNIIRKSKVGIVRHSYTTHVNELLKQGLHLLDFEISNLQSGNEFSTLKPTNVKGKLYKFPKNSEVFRFVWILIKNKFRFHFNELFRHENWNIGISTQSIEQVFHSNSLIVNSWFKERSNSTFAADPFICDFPPNNISILYEDFDYKKYKGVISKVHISSDFEFDTPKILIEKNFHLSFPFVLKHKDSVSVIPESQQIGQLLEYKLDLNYDLINSNIILEKDVVDPVLFAYKNKFWLFCGLKKYNPNNHLFVFHSDTLNGDFIPHSKNPIVSNVKNSRMAGGIFEYNSQIYRPSQVNDLYYGRKIAVMKIVELSENEYVEEFQFFINPPNDSAYSQGIHTFNFTDKLMVFDAKNYKFVLVQFLRVLKRKLLNR